MTGPRLIPVDPDGRQVDPSTWTDDEFGLPPQYEVQWVPVCCGDLAPVAFPLSIPNHWSRAKSLPSARLAMAKHLREAHDLDVAAAAIATPEWAS